MLGRRRLALFIFFVASVSCRYPMGVSVKPGARPYCEGGICLEIVSARVNRQTIGMWLDAPAGTQLTNARVARAPALPCSTGRSAEWVTSDREFHPRGPVDVAGSHGLVIGFPRGIWYTNQGENFVDLELSVAGTRRCIRGRLTAPDSQLIIGS
jgi:hypothetical protein